MAESHQARPCRVPDAKRRKAVLQSDAALDREKRRNLSLPLGLADIGRRERPHEDLGMSFVKLMDRVDQLENRAGRLLRRRGDEGRPDLSTEPPRLEARNIGVRVLVLARQIVAPHIALGLAIAADDEGEIIVPVEQRHLVEKAMGMGKRVVGSCGSRHENSRRSREKRGSVDPLHTKVSRREALGCLSFASWLRRGRGLIARE